MPTTNIPIYLNDEDYVIYVTNKNLLKNILKELLKKEIYNLKLKCPQCGVPTIQGDLCARCEHIMSDAKEAKEVEENE